MFRTSYFLIFLLIHFNLEARRGVWFTNVGSDIYDNKLNIEKALVEVKKLGFDSVYPAVWNKSQAFFRSRAISEIFGKEALQEYGDRDILQEFVELGQKHGLEVIPWFEYGLKIPYALIVDGKKKITSGGRVLRELGWLSEKRNGEVEGPCEFGVCKAFLNPAHPGVQEFLIEVFEELSSYDVSGVQIDDHFSLYHEFGYDSHMRVAFDAENYDFESEEEPEGIMNAFGSLNQLFGSATPGINFEDWRKNQVRDLIFLVSDTVRENGRKFILSPGGDNEFSTGKWQQDWLDLSRAGALDEIIVQVYRYSKNSFKATLNHPSLKEASRYQPMGVAVLAGLKGNAKVTGGAMVYQTREAEARGFEVSYFYYDTIRPRAVGKESQTQRNQRLGEIRRIFTGQDVLARRDD